MHACHKTSHIINLLNVDKATVCRVKKHLHDSEDIKDRPQSGRPTKLSSETTKKTFLAYPRMSMGEFAKKGVCKKTVVST